jgi:glyoxylase-like metal-dependent hydrolase (beta-lactamase superfamily II)
LGNKFVSDRYGLSLTSHAGEQVVLDAQPTVSQMYGISYLRSPDIKTFLAQDDILTFGNTSLKVLFTPGHSPASISLYNHESLQLIAGDVLFDGSIGRTDLPGGDFKTLIDSITTQLLKLDDKVVVYSGHGEITTIGKERRSNPFLT